MPKKVTSTYLLIFDLIDDAAPSSKHIISDTYDVRTLIKYIAEPKGCTIPDVKNVKNSRKGRQGGVWGSKNTNCGGNRVRILADYGANSRKTLHEEAHGTKEMHLELSQKLFNCDDVKGFLTKIGTLVMVFWYGDVEAKYERKKWKNRQKTWEEQQKLLKNRK